MFFSTLRNAIRRAKEAEADRDFWKKRAIRFEEKLEERTDFFVEREFRFIDRFFTAERKTYAITDEIRAKQNQVTDQEIDEHAKEAFLADKKQQLIDFARQAGVADPEDRASRDFETNKSSYILQFEGRM